MKNVVLDRLKAQIIKISPEGFDQLERIDRFDTTISRPIVLEILRFCCQAQNENSITTGRDAFKRLPQSWLVANLPSFLEEGINLSDDWEFRRFLELLREAKSPLLNKYLFRGLQSPSEEIREVAVDFQPVDNKRSM